MNELSNLFGKKWPGADQAERLAMSQNRVEIFIRNVHFLPAILKAVIEDPVTQPIYEPNIPAAGNDHFSKNER